MAMGIDHSHPTPSSNLVRNPTCLLLHLSFSSLPYNPLYSQFLTELCCLFKCLFASDQKPIYVLQFSMNCQLENVGTLFSCSILLTV